MGTIHQKIPCSYCDGQPWTSTHGHVHGWLIPPTPTPSPPNGAALIDMLDEELDDGDVLGLEFDELQVEAVGAAELLYPFSSLEVRILIHLGA